MNRYSLSLLIVVVLLFSIGLLMVFNTTSAEVLDRLSDRSTHYAFLKQIAYALVGLLGAFAVWKWGYLQLLQWSGPLLFAATMLLVLVFVPGVGHEINGAHRWIGVGGFSFQPSEFVKFLIPLYAIHVLHVAPSPVDLRTFLRLIGTIAIPLALILAEPDNGTVVIVLMALLALFLLARLRWSYWALPLSVLATCGAIAASQMPHVIDRFQVYLHPELDLQGKGHQPHQAKIAAGSGKLFGKGWGESLQKLDYLPEARSDYIAAIYAEECGFVGILGLILLYMSIGYLGFCIASKSRNLAGFYLTAILTFLICFQSFLNLGVVSGLLPSKGINLPFFSQGGSSLLVNAMALATIISVAQDASKRQRQAK